MGLSATGRDHHTARAVLGAQPRGWGLPRGPCICPPTHSSNVQRGCIFCKVRGCTLRGRRGRQVRDQGGVGCRRLGRGGGTLIRPLLHQPGRLQPSSALGAPRARWYVLTAATLFVGLHDAIPAARLHCRAHGLLPAHPGSLLTTVPGVRGQVLRILLGTPTLPRRSCVGSNMEPRAAQRPCPAAAVATNPHRWCP